MPRATNLAPNLSEEDAKRLVDTSIEEYDDDVRSMSTWEARNVEWIKLFLGHRDPKSFPWPNASNVHLPLIGTAVTQFNARALPVIIPGKEIVKVKSDPAARLGAKRVEHHMNWQLTEEMDCFEEDMDTMLIQLPVAGSSFKKISPDWVNKRVVSRLLRTGELVIPFGAMTLKDCKRKTHAYTLTPWQMKNMDKVWVNVKEALETKDTSTAKTPTPALKEERKELAGKEEPQRDREEDRLILEQHRWWKIDSDVEEPVIVTIDKAARMLLSVEKRSFTHPRTKEKLELDFFVNYRFFPNPDSLCGIGFGHLLQHLNESANILINELIDAGTLQNTKGGFINRRSALKRGDISYRMGEFVDVDVSADDLRKALMPMEFSPPSAALFSVLNLLQLYTERITSVSDVSVGRMPSSDTTATGNMLAVEQGAKLFTSIHKRIHSSFKKELGLIRFWNGRMANKSQNEMYAEVQDATSEEYAELISDTEKHNMKNDYENVRNIWPVSDPTVISQGERLQKAQVAYSTGLADPVIANDPEAMFVLRDNFFRALDFPDVRSVVKRPNILISPQEEHALFLRDMPGLVAENQNHRDHITQHQEFVDGEFGQQLTPEGQRLLQFHVREHLSVLFTQQQGQQQGTAQ